MEKELRKIVIFGAGGFGREVMDELEMYNLLEKKYNILGFVDDTEINQNKIINRYPVLGKIEWLLNIKEEIDVLICIGNPKNRKKVFQILKKNENIKFPNFISKDARVSKHSVLGIGSIICSSSIITTNVNIKEFVILNLDCTVGHDTIIENFVTVYPSVNISGNVHVGEFTEIGTGTNIIEKLNLGENVILGAGSVVTKNIESNCVAVGIPAKPIKYNN